MRTAVVFGYHDIGVRCLAVLLAYGVDVKLVVTHEDDPNETVWFNSVAASAVRHGIPVATPQSHELDLVANEVERLAPDFVFSFYYRYILPPRILDAATRGAFNMHGSLLPDYRGRAPVNWAILNGEKQTGASLHAMVSRPDAGALVDQTAVPILPNDIATQVMDKVGCAAEMTLSRCLPLLDEGTAELTPLELTKGRYYGRRSPEDGAIDWHQSAQSIHNLIRAVAPPYPGAFTSVNGTVLRLFKSWFIGEQTQHQKPLPLLYAQAGCCYIDCIDGQRLRVLDAEWKGSALSADALELHPLLLGE